MKHKDNIKEKMVLMSIHQLIPSLFLYRQTLTHLVQVMEHLVKADEKQYIFQLNRRDDAISRCVVIFSWHVYFSLYND